MRNEQEHHDQCVVMNWCKLNEKLYPCLAKIHAIPNGGDRHPAIGKKLKKEGVKAGMLDWCLPWPIFAFEKEGINYYSKCGLYVEMKTLPKHQSKISPSQRDWLKWFIDQGYEAFVAWSADEGIEILKHYVNPDETRWIDFN